MKRMRKSLLALLVVVSIAASAIAAVVIPSNVLNRRQDVYRPLHVESNDAFEPVILNETTGKGWYDFSVIVSNPDGNKPLIVYVKVQVLNCHYSDDVVLSESMNSASCGYALQTSGKSVDPRSGVSWLTTAVYGTQGSFNYRIWAEGSPE